MVELVKGQRLELPDFVAHVWRWRAFDAHVEVWQWRNEQACSAWEWREKMRSNYRAALYSRATNVQRVGVVIAVFGYRFHGLVWRYYRRRWPEVMVTDPARIEAAASGLRAAWVEMQLRADG